jgi:signal peptidase I
MLFRRGDKPKKKKSVIREYTEIIVLAVALALFARTFFIQAFRIPSESMENTLLVGDFLFANKLIYGPKIPFINVKLPGIRSPKPGDIVIFKYPGDRNTDYIKRCVAVAGQTVELRGTDLYIDGILQEEWYSHYRDIPGYNRQYGPFKVPEGHIFMMGDNRDNSADSRAWGPLPLDLVLGKAMFIYFSWNPQSHSIRFSRIGDIIR